MFQVARNGYRPKHPTTDVLLGIFDGLEMSLWGYVYAAIIFSGVMSVFLPVGIISVLVAWSLFSYWVILTSKEPLHMTDPDEQAVVVFGTISSLMVVSMGDAAASPGGLSTLLFIMASTVALFALSCYLVGKHRLSRILELMPYPVVCGFMASIGWLLMEAAVEVSADVYFTLDFFSQLQEGNNLLRLSLAAALGTTLFLLMQRLDRSWLLPAAAVIIVVSYYVAMGFIGLSHEEQIEQGWLFQLAGDDGGVLDMISTISPALIEWGFVAQVVPQIIIIVFLAMLYVSMMLTTLKATSEEKLDISAEFKVTSAGNIPAVALCAPPVYTDIVATRMYREFGASSRWLPLISATIALCVAMFGGAIVTWLPKLLMAASIFLFALQTLYEWLVENARGFSRTGYALVWIILLTTVFAGFVAGIGIGVILTAVLFIVRYSSISAIQSRHTLLDRRSSVERSVEDNAALDEAGDSVIIYNLRGYLFFGTANAIHDRIVELEPLHEDTTVAILMDLRRVTGMDISALNTFAQIRSICDADEVRLVFANASQEMQQRLLAVGAVSEQDGQTLLFEQEDFAIEFLENEVLKRRPAASEQRTIRDYLDDLLISSDYGTGVESNKVELLMQAMERVECSGGETLFSQDEIDDGLYIVESGALSAMIRGPDGSSIRVRKFVAGSLIGELSAYLGNKRRTASIVADEDCVLYHLNLDRLEHMGEHRHEAQACIHEMVATVLAERVSFMNRRLISGG